MLSDKIDTSRLLIRKIADDIERWPSPELVSKLCREAEDAALIEPECASSFTDVKEAGLELLSIGGDKSLNRLPDAIDDLDDAVRLVKITLKFADTTSGTDCF